MNDKHILLIFVAAILLILLSFGAFNIIGNSTDENNTTDVNLTLNETNDTNNTTVETSSKSNSNNKNVKTSQSNKDNEVYYDEKLNVYFDKNGKTAYDGQVPKGTSRSDLEKMSQAESSGNLE